jgi:hypothetical protein
VFRSNCVLTFCAKKSPFKNGLFLFFVIIRELIKYNRREKTMTTITIDDEMINELVAVSHFKNDEEAIIKIIADYLQLHKKEPTLFDQLRLS